MTVSNTYTQSQYLGNGTTTTFPFSYPFFALTDLNVLLFNTSTLLNVSPTPALNGSGTYDYTITGNQDLNTGEYLGGATVTFNTAPAGGVTVTISRAVASTQEVSLTENAPFPSKTIEGALDRLTMLNQQVSDGLSRAVVVPPSDGSPDMVLPPAGTRAGKWMAFDSNGLPIAALAGPGGAAISTAMLPVLDASTTAAAAALLLPITQLFNLASIAALRAFNGGSANPAIQVEGYSVPGVGGGLYLYVASDTTSTDNGGTIIRDAAGHRYYRAGTNVDATCFGADPTGVSDSTAAIQAALGIIGQNQTPLLPAGTFKISSTLNLNANGLKLTGSGRGGWHDTGTQETATTVLTWAGSSGGTMISIQPTGAQGLRDCWVTGIALNPGAGCSNGVVVNSLQGGVFKFGGLGFSGALMSTGCLTTLSEAADTQMNDIDLWYYGLGASGAILTLGGSATASSSFNLIRRLRADYQNGTCLSLTNANNNLFEQVLFVRATGGTGTGIQLNAGATSTTCTRGNLFEDCQPGGGGVYAVGTENGVIPSTNNHIIYYDQQNSAPTPFVGTTATLWWSGNEAPFGFQQFAESSSGLASVSNAGHIRQSGLTGTVAANGSTVIALPITMSSFASVVSVLPETGPGTYCAACSTSQLTIQNGPVDNAFRWLVEGR